MGAREEERNEERLGGEREGGLDRRKAGRSVKQVFEVEGRFGRLWTLRLRLRQAGATTLFSPLHAKAPAG